MRADIFGNFFELLHGKEQTVASRIANPDIVAGHAVHGQRFDARVLPDSVIFVNDVVARFQFGVGEDTFGIFPLFLFQRAFSADAERRRPNLGIRRKHGKARNGQFEPREIILPKNRDRPRGKVFGRSGFFDHIATRLGNLFAQPFRVNLVFGKDGATVTATQIALQIFHENILIVEVCGSVPRAEAKQPRETSVCQIISNGIDMQGDVCVEERVECRRGLGVFGIPSRKRSGFEQFGDCLLQMPFRGFNALADGIRPAQNDQSTVGKIVEQTVLFGINQRNIFVEKRNIAAVAQSGVYRRGFARQFLNGGFLTGFFDLRPDRFFQAFETFFVAEQFASGLKFGFRDRLHHSLRIGFKKAHTVDLVSKQFDAKRIRAAKFATVTVGEHAIRGINVHDPAANGELPGAIHQIHAHESRIEQTAGKIGGFNRRILRDRNGGSDETFGRNGITERGVGRGQNNVIIAAEKPRQHFEPLVFVFVRGGHVVKGQIAPHIEARAQTETVEHGEQTHTFFFFGADQERGPVARVFRVFQQGDQQRVRRTVANAGNRDGERRNAKILPDRLEQLRIFGVGTDRSGQDTHARASSSGRKELQSCIAPSKLPDRIFFTPLSATAKAASSRRRSAAENSDSTHAARS